MRTIDANTLSGSARDTAGSTSSFGDNSATYQRIVKEIRARRNPISFDGTEFESWRYITLQIVDIDTIHNDLRNKGVREGLAPVTLGNVARISMILDPDGNWIELSRRASIADSLT
jgi:hypothetical protein